MAGDDEQGGVHEPVVDEDRARQPEAGVALAVPEQQTGEEEEDGEGGGNGGVQLLARVEAALRRAAAAQPATVVGVEEVEIARRSAKAAPVAGGSDEQDRARPADARVEVDVFDQRPAPDNLGEAGQVEDQPGAEEEEEGACVHPVQRALRPREPAQVDRSRRRSHSSGRPRRRGRSRAAPSTRRAGDR